jgi:5-methyltetrahydropteroyltriglutamate--homocysteine methyltransferase
LVEAREQWRQGTITSEQLRAIENHCIRDAIRMQEEIGLESITDGEFRRGMFHLDFLEQIEGIAIQGGISRKFHKAGGEVDFAPPRIIVTGKLRHTHAIQRADFEFLSASTDRTPKVTIPSPTMVHFRGGRQAIDATAYPDLDEFYADLADVFRRELGSLADAGCRYVQLDDTNLAYLCDPKLRVEAAQRGDNPEDLALRYARLINNSIRDCPSDMVVTIHLCRGNFRSAWVAEGGYEPVAEVLFNVMNVDGFFLEYDDARSGDFAPLRMVPNDKIVVLGLVTSKAGTLEPQRELIARVREAARYLPLEQLCLSPQCGFASSVNGNDISPAQQEAKLRLVVDTAAEIWG